MCVRVYVRARVCMCVSLQYFPGVHALVWFERMNYSHSEDSALSDSNLNLLEENNILSTEIKLYHLFEFL